MSEIKDFLLGNEKFNPDAEIKIVDQSPDEDPLPKKK
jgi:hypothetical protein